MALVPRSVWFFLVEVEVTGDTLQPWTRGSTVMFQCFAPGRPLEDTLQLLDAFLETKELRRIDTCRAIRYDPTDEPAEYPGDYFRDPLEEAAAQNECVLGISIVSEESATWRDEVER
jgi:hypothetical protein